MIAEKLYDRAKNHKGRLGTWGLCQIFRLHAWELKHGLTKRFTTSTAMIERDWSKQCAAMIEQIGIDDISKSREWVPLQVPEKLDQVQIGIFRHNLDQIMKWRKENPAP